MGAVTGGRQPSHHVATADDLVWLVETWTAAAVRVMQAGADAIEIHCAHGYILGAFLNRRDNLRSDQYGGSLENRARLEIGRAHVCTPVTNAHLVCRLMLEKQNTINLH